MNSKAKKIVIAAVLFLLAIAAWQSILGDNMHVNIDGDEIDGPLGALFGMFLAGGGILIATVAVICAALFVGLLFASLGIVLVGALALAAVLVVAAVAPLMLPLVIVCAIVYYGSGRARRQRQRAAMDHAV
jgi:hypothetical protein